MRVEPISQGTATALLQPIARSMGDTNNILHRLGVTLRSLLMGGPTATGHAPVVLVRGELTLPISVGKAESFGNAGLKVQATDPDTEPYVQKACADARCSQAFVPMKEHVSAAIALVVDPTPRVMSDGLLLCGAPVVEGGLLAVTYHQERHTDVATQLGTRDSSRWHLLFHDRLTRSLFSETAGGWGNRNLLVLQRIDS